MKISDYLHKKPWSRRVVTGTTQNATVTTGATPVDTTMKLPSGKNEYFNQDRFMDELHSGSHIIYNIGYRSMRPKFEYDLKTNKNVIKGYEDVVRSPVSWQEAIRGNKVATCGGNPIWIGNESGEDGAERVNRIKAYANTANIQSAFLQHFNAIFGTGDGALYFYRDDDEVKWKCFSYEEGDNCTVGRDYEHPDREMGIRYFSYEGYDAVEFYRDETIELYVKFKDEETMIQYFPDAIGEMTEDDYYLIKKTKHGLDESPFCYYREADVPWGGVQHNIEDFEDKVSDCGENIKYYAYQMLWLSGGAISLPDVNFGGKVIGSASQDGDAKILEPADASNILDIGFKKIYNAICDGSKSVFIKPEDLKGQNDSGAYIANLYWPELQWATMFYGRYTHCVQKILRVFKKTVGLIESDYTGYSAIKMSYAFEPYIPKNKLEQTTILQQAVTGGFLSVETATEEFDSANPQELERLKREADEKEKRQAREMEMRKQQQPAIKDPDVNKKSDK